MENIVWSPMADTCVCLCKSSRINITLKCHFSVLKAIDPIPFQCYKEGCNKSRCSKREWRMCLPPFPNQGLHRPGRSCLPKRHCDTWQLPTSILPLGKAPTEFQTLLDWTSWLPPSALCLGSHAKFCSFLTHLFPSVYSQTAKQVWIKQHSEVQILLSTTELDICVRALGCMKEVSCLSSLPCNPKLKLAEVRGSLSLFSVSVDQHHFKPESQYLLNTAFHTWSLCKAEQKEHAIYKHVEESIMKFFVSIMLCLNWIFSLSATSR